MKLLAALLALRRALVIAAQDSMRVISSDAAAAAGREPYLVSLGSPVPARAPKVGVEEQHVHGLAGRAAHHHAAAGGHVLAIDVHLDDAVGLSCRACSPSCVARCTLHQGPVRAQTATQAHHHPTCTSTGINIYPSRSTASARMPKGLGQCHHTRAHRNRPKGTKAWQPPCTCPHW